jgi:hypothetical protein
MWTQYFVLEAVITRQATAPPRDCRGIHSRAPPQMPLKGKCDGPMLWPLLVHMLLALGAAEQPNGAHFNASKTSPAQLKPVISTADWVDRTEIQVGVKDCNGEILIWANGTWKVNCSGCLDVNGCVTKGKLPCCSVGFATSIYSGFDALDVHVAANYTYSEIYYPIKIPGSGAYNLSCADDNCVILVIRNAQTPFAEILVWFVISLLSSMGLQHKALVSQGLRCETHYCKRITILAQLTHGL